jgi:hypothetical protein
VKISGFFCFEFFRTERTTALILQLLMSRTTKASPISLVVLSELLQLPFGLVTVDILAELEKLRPDRNEDRSLFDNSAAFIRAAALDRIGRHSEAWDQIVAANGKIWSGMQRGAAELSATQKANLSQLRDKSIKVFGDATGSPISLFILGPSRSGKTTMEMLVGTLDGVRRGYESPSVENAVQRTFQSAGLLTSKLFEVLPPTLDASCREVYLREIAHRCKGAKVFTNTHPGRIHDVARVAASFPNVRFIFLKRNLDDNMLRIFMQRYETANPYAYDLTAIRDHLIWYHEMIDLLAGKLSGIARIVHYEEMVADPRGAQDMAAELCGLPSSAKPLPAVGNDADCGAPYRSLLEAAFRA